MIIDPATAARLRDEATRGPWKVNRYGSLVEVEGRDGEPGVYEYDTYVLLFEHDHGCGCRRDCTAEVTLSEADARLIAAAPDLAETVATEPERIRAAVVEAMLWLADRAVLEPWTARALLGRCRAIDSGASWTSPTCDACDRPAGKHRPGCPA